MGLWAEQTAGTSRKERLTKLGPIRDAAPVIARIRADAESAHAGNAEVAYRAFETKAIAVMKEWGANDRTYGMTSEAATSWAKAHSGQIKLCSADFRWRLMCFNDDDFASEAVVSALEAADIAKMKAQPFEGIFWNGFMYRLEHLCNGSLIGERYHEDKNDSREVNCLGSMDTSPDIQLEKARQEMFHVGPRSRLFIKWATWIMTEDEAAAWLFYMSDSRPTTQEVGERLNLTRQGAEYRLKQALAKVEKGFREIGIMFDSDTKEITSEHRLLIGVDIADTEIDEAVKQPPPESAGRKRPRRTRQW